ncbi:MAG TPA: hypothetical protein VMJ65_07945 [Solirubrobacteraceae bacterium]|nr:hypothetical protein [Solirubrobacteraceae bacterium]
MAFLAVAATAFPAGAQAIPYFHPPGDPHANPPAQLVRIVREPEVNGAAGFQWGDAGIGGAGGIVLVGAGAGAAAVIRRRRTHRIATA